MLAEQIDGDQRVTVGGDKGYDTRGFVQDLRNRNVTPRVSQNTNRAGGSAIEGRTTRHAGYSVSQRKRKRIEEVFVWLKRVGMLQSGADEEPAARSSLRISLGRSVPEGQKPAIHVYHIHKNARYKLLGQDRKASPSIFFIILLMGATIL